MSIKQDNVDDNNALNNEEMEESDRHKQRGS